MGVGFGISATLTENHYFTLACMVAMVVVKGMGTGIITNGWLLSARLEELSDAGLKKLYMPINSPFDNSVRGESRTARNRERICASTRRMPKLGMMALAQVTMSKLIDDYRNRVPLLRELGFEAVASARPASRGALDPKRVDRRERFVSVAFRDATDFG